MIREKVVPVLSVSRIAWAQYCRMQRDEKELRFWEVPRPWLVEGISAENSLRTSDDMPPVL